MFINHVTLTLIIGLLGLIECLSPASGRSSKREGETGRKRLLPWSVDEYPNPWKEPIPCGRMLPSTICDPDRMLRSDLVQSLDKTLWEHGRNSRCHCPSCALAKQGIPIGIAMMEDLIVTENGGQSSIIKGTLNASQWQRIADSLRSRWHFGDCDNDVLILLTPYGGVISLGNFTRKLLKDSQVLNLSPHLIPKTSEEQGKLIFSIVQEVHSFGQNRSTYLSALLRAKLPFGLDEVKPLESRIHVLKTGEMVDVESSSSSSSSSILTSSPINKPISVAPITAQKAFKPLSVPPPLPSAPSSNSQPQPLPKPKVQPPVGSRPTIISEEENEIDLSSSFPLSAAGSSPMKTDTFIAAPEDDEFPVPQDNKVNASLAFIIVGSLTVLLVSLIALFLIIWYYRTKTGNIEPATMYSKPQPAEKTPTSIDIKAVKYEPCKTDEPGLPV